MAALKDVCPFLLFICTALQECSHGRSRHRGGQEAGGGGNSPAAYDSTHDSKPSWCKKTHSACHMLSQQCCAGY